jgi:hypothetical protein
MTLTALILLSISAALRAAWNLLSKREHPTAAFKLAANTLGCLGLLPALLLYLGALWAFTGRYGAIWR